MFRAKLIRPDDLLHLDIEGVNLSVDTSDLAAPVVAVDDTGQPGLLIVRFPPQTVVEEAVYESDEPFAPVGPQRPQPTAKQAVFPALPLRARIGGETRLVLLVPPGRILPYSIDGLLDWAGLRLQVSPLADIPADPAPEDIDAAPPITRPLPTQTAIELPYRLVLSPASHAMWRHQRQPVERRGRAELWHTVLSHALLDGTPEPASTEHPIPLRAIWSQDYNPRRFTNPTPPLMGRPDQDWDNGGDPTKGVLTAMTPSDRHEIVILTSAFAGFVKGLVDDAPGVIDKTPFVPTPVQAALLVLTPLGGYLTSRGHWRPPVPARIKRRVVEPPPGGGIFDDLTDHVLVPRNGNPLRIPDPLLDPDPPLLGALDPQGPTGGAVLGGAVDAGATDVGALRHGAQAPNVRVLRSHELLNLPDWLEDIDVALPWEYGASLNVSEWVHNATLGRDHYVRIVYEGRVHPSGHRAALIKITERKLRDAPSGPVAYLAQRMFVVIRQPEMDYRPDIAADPAYGRQMPFHSIRFTTLITPDITPPDVIPGTESSFVITVGGQPFRFHGRARRGSDDPTDFSAVLEFVPNSDANHAALAQVRAAHLRLDQPTRAWLVPGQRITYADRDPDAGTDNTSLITSAFHLSSSPRGEDPAAYFVPILFAADVRLPAVEQLLGRDAVTTIAYAPTYLADGFDGANATGLFARMAREHPTQRGTMVDHPLPAQFSADQAGGVATPSMALSALTRALGPMAGDDLEQIAHDEFDPAQFFKGALGAARLFGSFALVDLLRGGSLSGGAPTIQTTTAAVGADPAVRRVTATFDWVMDVQDVDAGIVVFRPLDGATFALHGTVERTVAAPPAAAPADASSVFEGLLTQFDIDLLAVVAIHFESFRFSSRSGAKPDVAVALREPDPVTFQGDLEFVNELKKAIPPGLFGDGASLDISSTRIKAGFAIALPPIAIGVFALDGVALSAAVELPFADGKPLFDFGVSSREHPFCLTVAFLGGGGFFHLQVDAAGIRLLEAALEFGASASIDLGVASGGVQIMAGVYFAMGTRNGKEYSILSGYLRLGGELSVLGLISISLEFLLSFGYEAGKAAGRATLTVKVEVAFFSTSVELTVEKKFGGSSGDPRFAQVIESPAVWDQYASAFA